MLSTASLIFILLTIIFVSICITLGFKKAPPPQKSIFYTEKGSIPRIYDPNHRKRLIWSGICMALSILTMLLSIIFAGISPKSGDGDPTPSPSNSVNETPNPVVSSSPGSVAERTPNPFESESIEQSDSDWLDDINPLFCYPGNFYQDGWADKSPFDLNGVEFDHGVGMCIVGSRFEKMVDKKDSYLRNERWDCREAFILYQLNKKYETLTFSIGVDSGEPTLFGPREDNGVVQVVIKDWSTNEELFNTGYQDYTYATSNIEIDVSRVDVLQIIVRSGSVSSKRITKSLRFVLVNPTLTLSES